MTLGRRVALEQALRRAGVSLSRSLLELELDDPVVLALAKPSRRRRAQRWLARGIALAVGLLGATAAVAQLWPLVRSDGLERMSGDLNIAIAGFAGPGVGAEDGRLLASSVTRSVQASLAPRHADAAGPDVQVRQLLGSFPGALRPAAREAGAARLAGQLGADIVIYGRVATRSGRTRVLPEIYVDPRRLIGAEELAGAYALPPIDAGYLSVTDAVAARVKLRLALSRQLHALTYFAAALSWFNGGDFERSRRLLLTAVRAWPRRRDAGLPLLFLGNADGKRGRLREAGRAYRAALGSRQVRARARLGLTELALHRAQAGCGSRTQLAPLLAVARRFARLGADAATGTLPGQALALRSQLGEGRVDVCVSQARLADRWSAAMRHMRAVIAAGGADRGRFARELAEAHAGLGLALLPPAGGRAGAAASYRRARVEYRTAASLAVDPDRRRTFEGIVRYIESRLRVPASSGGIHAIDGSVLLRHDAPPAGVRRQVAYVGGAGPLDCATPHETDPRLSVYARAIAPRADTRPAIGDVLVVCTDGFAPGSPVDVTVAGSGRRVLHAIAPASDAVNYYRGVEINLLPGLPLGRYRVRATQHGHEALAGFTLSAATQPGLRVVRAPTRRGDSALVLGVGLPHDAIVRVYRQGEGGPPDYGWHSTYVASFPAAPARDGTTLMRISTRAGMPADCWWLVVTVHGSSAYDQLCVF